MSPIIRSPRPAAFLTALVVSLVAAQSHPRTAASGAFEISYPGSLERGPITGRLFVIITKNNRTEPRLQAGSYAGSAPFFGVDVEALRPGQHAVINASTLGYPRNLRDLPAGDYYVQALLNVYTQVRRKDGHVLWVHLDQWEGQQWNLSPGNLVSDAVPVHLDPAVGFKVKLSLSRKLPPVNVPPDGEWVRRVKFQSPMLSEFWGRPIYLGATVLLPKGYDRDPDRKYPAVYVQGHFELGAPFGFNEQARPRTETPEQQQARFSRTARETPYEFVQSWTSDDFPRMIAITFQHPTPYYDDSYAVNSVNEGPYADALLQELIPFLENRFRILPDARARALTGGSTGGWEALALQIQHPTFFNGTWAFYPDPVDFRRNQMIDIYRDENAFEVAQGDWAKLERPISRNPDGQVTLTMREMGRLEAVLGSNNRSGQQIAAFDAAWGPMDSAGYPRPLWNRQTGRIDKEVATYMREHGFDLRDYLEKSWPTIGRDLAGKLHIYVGDMDNYYLNLAVYLLDDFLKAARNPAAKATVEYGRPMKPHGWQPFTNAELIRTIAGRIGQATDK